MWVVVGDIHEKSPCFIRIGIFEAFSSLQVKAVKRKHRRACVLFIDGTTNEKKKG